MLRLAIVLFLLESQTELFPPFFLLQTVKKKDNDIENADKAVMRRYLEIYKKKNFKRVTQMCDSWQLLGLTRLTP